MKWRAKRQRSTTLLNTQPLTLQLIKKSYSLPRRLSGRTPKVKKTEKIWFMKLRKTREHVRAAVPSTPFLGACFKTWWRAHSADTSRWKWNKPRATGVEKKKTASKKNKVSFHSFALSHEVNKLEKSINTSYTPSFSCLYPPLLSLLFPRSDLNRSRSRFPRSFSNIQRPVPPSIRRRKGKRSRQKHLAFARKV